MTSRRDAGAGSILSLVLAAVMAAVSAAPELKPACAADDASALAETIDRLVAARWAENRVTPAPEADDAEFLRRVTLDLTGKIPTVGEVRAFLDDDDPRPEKRARLVERLLDGPAYITHTTNVELRRMIPEADANPEVQALVPAFEAWLGDQVRTNAGSDTIVRALLTAPVPDTRTRAQQQRNPLANQGPSLSPLPFYLAKDVKSENLAASTARLFLGLRLECAQCHNHPFASWTRDQFWGYAAFFASLERDESDDALFPPIRERPERREAAVPVPGAGGTHTVSAAFLDGSAPRARPQEPARIALADWMTAPDNPYFARAAVNRIWAQLFGIGLVDPVDDLGPDNPPSHPELLDALARAFIAHGFDRKFLIRAVVLSRPYQLTSTAPAPGAGAGGAGTSADDPRLFARMRERGLTAEQLYDSLARAIGRTPDESAAEPFAAADAVNSPRAAFLEKFGGHDDTPAAAQMTILQALALINGPLVAGATHPERGAMLSAVAGTPFLDTAGRVEVLFLATVSRPPRPDETARMVAYVDGGGTTGDHRKALSDVFWALLNSPEFLLNH